MSKNRFQPKIEVNNQEDAVEQIIKQQKQKEIEEDIHRVNFNMPKYLHEMVQDKIRKKRYNLTTYLLTLVRKDLGEE
jgi:hypothetical protein